LSLNQTKLMREIKLTNSYLPAEKRFGILIPIAVLWGLAIVLSVIWLLVDDEFGNPLKEYYLLPYAFLTGIIILAPSIYLYYQNKFDLFHPLVYAAWSYCFPAFVGGGVIMAFKWNDQHFFAYIEDQETTLPITLGYVAIGFIGIIIGFFLPVGKLIGSKLNRFLPNWEWKPEQVWSPGVLLIIAGIAFNLIGFINGLIGFQRAATVEIFDGVLFFLIILYSQGNILLWQGVFQAKKRNTIFYVILLSLIILIPLRGAMLGSRSGLMISIIPIVMAFLYSGRKLRWQQTAVIGAILSVVIFFGVAYGTAFRNMKGSEARMDAGDYVGQVFATVDYLTSNDPIVTVQSSLIALAERIDNLSALAVVVSNYEKLAQFEEDYGLENNIVNDFLTSFIPRFIWADKPHTSDARAYSELYFNYGDNSFAVTPFGDLLRNFGPIGVPLGMMVLGFYLRIIYFLFIENGQNQIWRKVAYFPLLTIVSYEAFYATIFPSVIRVTVVLIISLWIANFVTKSVKKSR
jgi:hypothetical protein